MPRSSFARTVLMSVAVAVSTSCSQLQTSTSQSPLGAPVNAAFSVEDASGRRQPPLAPIVDGPCLTAGLGCLVRGAPSVPLSAPAIPGVPISLASSVTGTTVTLTWTLPAGDPSTSFVV
jgi:hypothetical protein